MDLYGYMSYMIYPPVNPISGGLLAHVFRQRLLQGTMVKLHHGHLATIF